VNDIKNELRAVEKLCVHETHPNIVKVLRHGKLPNSPYYFLDMELCGDNLETFIKNHCRVGGTAVAVLTLFKDIVAGIEYIHANGEVHRDLKPANGNKTSN
jgi:serine/threonine protein kinase